MVSCEAFAIVFFVSDLNTVAVQETQITFFLNLNASESVSDKTRYYDARQTRFIIKTCH